MVEQDVDAPGPFEHVVNQARALIGSEGLA
jgi:hypothetical protein